MKIKYLFILLITSLLLACPADIIIESNDKVHVNATVYYDSNQSIYKTKVSLYDNAIVYETSVGGDEIVDATVQMNSTNLPYDTFAYKASFNNVPVENRFDLLINNGNNSYTSSVVVPETCKLDSPASTPGSNQSEVIVEHDVNSDLTLNWTLENISDEIEIRIYYDSSASGEDIIIKLTGDVTNYTIPARTLIDDNTEPFICIRTINRSKVVGDNLHNESSFKAINELAVKIVKP